MDKGKSKKISMIFRYLDNMTKNNMEAYVNESINKYYYSIRKESDLNSIFQDNIREFLHSLSEEELLDLRTYTGYNFRNINAILRNNWTYQENGYLDDNIKNEYLILANKISNILKKFPPLKTNIMTFRGTTLASFKKYGIESISDLVYMAGNYMYDEGFTSSSIIESDCYFNKRLETGENYNIEIRFLITPDCKEGALLNHSELSFSPNQNEFLICKNSLSKIVDVKIDENSQTAVLTAVLVPERIWNLDTQNEYEKKTM